MKNYSIQSEERFFTFSKKYYIIQGNNGNHTGCNREWTLFSYGFDTKKEANKAYNEAVKENGDIEFGLTPLQICTGKELVEIYESQERIYFSKCFDIK